MSPDDLAISIAPATARHAPAIRAIYAPIVTDTAISFELEVPSIAMIEERIERTAPFAPWLVATTGRSEEEPEVAGYAYATQFRARAAYAQSAEVSVYVGAGHRRGGVARRLYGRLFEELRARAIHRLIAGVTLPNDASVEFHESLGFHPVGVFHEVGRKFGQWHDVGFWEMPLSTE